MLAWAIKRAFAFLLWSFAFQAVVPSWILFVCLFVCSLFVFSSERYVCCFSLESGGGQCCQKERKGENSVSVVWLGAYLCAVLNPPQVHVSGLCRTSEDMKETTLSTIYKSQVGTGRQTPDVRTEGKHSAGLAGPW